MRSDLELAFVALGWLLAIVFISLYIRLLIRSRMREATLVFWCHDLIEGPGSRNRTVRQLGLEFLTMVKRQPHRTLLKLEESFEERG